MNRGAARILERLGLRSRVEDMTDMQLTYKVNLRSDDWALPSLQEMKAEILRRALRYRKARFDRAVSNLGCGRCVSQE